MSGPLYIPILGRIFPRPWGDRREVQRTRYLIHTDAGSFEVSEAAFHIAVVIGSISPGDLSRPAVWPALRAIYTGGMASK